MSSFTFADEILDTYSVLLLDMKQIVSSGQQLPGCHIKIGVKGAMLNLSYWYLVTEKHLKCYIWCLQYLNHVHICLFYFK